MAIETTEVPLEILVDLWAEGCTCTPVFRRAITPMPDGMAVTAAWFDHDSTCIGYQWPPVA